ncbi:MAG TPA: DinB family protein [Bryobacteraceae bacterium]|nr:DinB family protein [Bryobacteraceae bacterium]
MQPARALEPFSVVDSLLAAYATNNRINEFLIHAVPDPAWRAAPHGGKGRTIASMAAHIHNVRLMWLKSAARDAPLPAKLDGESCTKADAIRLLNESWRALEAVLRASLPGNGAIRGFKPDAAGFLAYLLAHDAHHRGQIAMLARQVGYPLSQSAGFGMWEWGTR